jgi:hypothetical protein
MAKELISLVTVISILGSIRMANRRGMGHILGKMEAIMKDSLKKG